MPSVLFVANHCFADLVSGATVSLRELFYYLAERGWDTRVLCGSEFDGLPTSAKKVFKDRPGLSAQSWCDATESPRFTLHRIEEEKTRVVIFDPVKWGSPPPVAFGYPFLQVMDRMLSVWRPDVILTFGGGWMGRGVKTVAARHGVPLVFWLRNDKYQHKELFESMAGAIVPSRVMADHYFNTIGLRCDAIPSPIRPERVQCTKLERRFATFVTPLPDKGVFYFSRIAAELGRQRPDIPVLVAVGRGNLQWLRQSGLNLRALPNFKVMRPSLDPLDFLSVSRVLLAPSLWQETFLRIAVEGMLNGIPTLASRRGGIPSTLGRSGFLFDIPPAFTSAMRQPPAAGEVAPWVETIIRLWDDAAFYNEQIELCLNEAKRFSPETVIPLHEAVLQRAMSKSQLTTPARSLAEDLAKLQPLVSEPMGLEKFPEISGADEFLRA